MRAAIVLVLVAIGVVLVLVYRDCVRWFAEDERFGR